MLNEAGVKNPSRFDRTTKLKKMSFIGKGRFNCRVGTECGFFLTCNARYILNINTFVPYSTSLIS